MNLLLIAPLLLVVVGSVAGWFLPNFAGPARCVRVLTVLVVVAAAGVTSGLLLVLVAAVSETPAVSELIGWCRALYPGDHGAAPWAGVVAGLALVVSGRSMARYWHLVRSEQRAFAHVCGIELVRTAGPVAFAVPGRPGGVVLGDQLLGALAPDERRVVLAHEQAHLDLRHHRYVRTANACAAAFPFLIPLARQVRFNSERWADEAAAQKVGSRSLVARVIAKVALLGDPTHPKAGLAFAGNGVTARVDALLHPERRSLLQFSATTSTATILVTIAGASVQVHHLAEFLVKACS